MSPEMDWRGSWHRRNLPGIAVPPADAPRGRTGMNGDRAGTSGGNPGTSGMIPLKLFGVAVLITGVIISVNISSDLIENPPGHRSFDLWEPFCWEISSALGFAALWPAAWAVYGRLHWRRLGAGRFIAAQVVCAIVYSLLHVAIMVALRHVTYLA